MKTMTEDAIEHFSAKLRFETDPSDVHAAFERGERFVLIDSRAAAAWNHGRVAGAVHLPTAEIEERAPGSIPLDTPVVVYCWGPGCNGSTRAALAFSRLGYEVREMIGGYEYWVREGLPTEDESGRRMTASVDPLTAPRGIGCAC